MQWPEVKEPVLGLICPLCGMPQKDHFALSLHAFALHPLSGTPGIEYMHSMLEFSEHLIMVAMGEVELAERFRKYIVKGSGAHARHAAQIAMGKGRIVFGTQVSPLGRSLSNVTYATKKRRKP